MSDLLQVKNLKVEFQTQAGVVRAVENISLRVRAGSTVALVGESGSGKTITAQAIMGILPRTARIADGQILLADPAEGGAAVDLAKLNPDSPRFRSIRGNRISIIFQEPMTSLSPLHTIGDQISETLFLHRNMSKAEGLKTTVEMLRLVGFPNPDEALNAYPFELSGGLRQRVMIAMALVCRPALLIADEPSTALDVTIQAQILKLLKDLQAELGMAVLIITHDLGVVANVAEEVFVAYNGNIVESGTLEDIFRTPTHPYLKALLAAVPRFNMKPGERLIPLREITHKTGHLLVADPNYIGKIKTAATPLLDVQDVSKCFTTRKKGGFLGSSRCENARVVDDVSFQVKHGECLGLVGESGCGKTTLSKIIMRAINADSGKVLFCDNGNQINLLELNDAELAPLRRKFQYVFQDPFGSLNPRMTIFDILSEPLVIHNIGDAAYRREMTIELMNLAGLDPRFLNRYPHSFSGGQRQRIGIARALALKPKLLICDEPVSSLDVSIQAQILNLLKDLQDELGLTYLFISHNLAVVNYIADRIAVMCAGRIVEIAPCDLLFENPVHPYTQALVSAAPFPDPEHRLDFSALAEGKASDPDAWPAPFNIRSGEDAGFIDLGGGHLVRAHAMPKSGAAA
ncbi:MAG: ABC transporter ATP-binding protein [Rhodospirillales bacterium RIFCSPLOWO2_12_FULL_58_28]|nr:MAG: ABC transporter ATP-binding protein [Rhodospirillales bacterium RIFCSPLOWO2_02_FULL_58_16]OHC76924.1 MAG: ABC transporter ATP-binding protein [Rhodospirillales bacterium RIFCSPLOWO2_12_FULL_58_28]